MYIVQLRSKNKQTGKMYNSSCLLDSKKCLFEPYHKGKLIYVHVHTYTFCGISEQEHNYHTTMLFIILQIVSHPLENSLVQSEYNHHIICMYV